MSSGFADLLSKGGPWPNILLAATPFWLVVLVVLIVAQRRSLRRLVAHTINTAPYPPAADPAGQRIIGTCLDNMGPLGGGTIGTLWLGLWWLLVLAAAVWSVHSPVDIVRFNEPGYVDSVMAGGSARDLAHQLSTVLITRSFIGILGVPNLIVTLLALDQIVFRPRTRLRDEIGRQWLHRGGDSAEIPTTADNLGRIRSRAGARFSWMVCFFTWIWLLAKGLPKQALLLLVGQFALGIAVGFLEHSGLVPSWTSPGFQLGVEPTAGAIFWRPFLGGLAIIGPSILLIVWLGVMAPRWAAKR